MAPMVYPIYSKKKKVRLRDLDKKGTRVFLGLAIIYALLTLSNILGMYL